ncbi:MAG: O-antigen ligase domain-containing protein, partial [Sphingobacteriales bacterium]
DHVRFSWLVCIAVLTGSLLLDNYSSSKMRVVWMIAILLLIIYLHILSARTGLAMVYVFGVAFALYKLKRRPGVSLLVLGILAAALLIGWFCFPTFQNRIRYNLYDLSFVMQDKYVSGTSDGNRVISLKAGWHLLKQHPFTGVGAGDVRREINLWYDHHVQGIKDSDKLYPSSEWIVYGGIAGWPGIVLFTMAVLFPLFIKKLRHRFFWIILHVTAIMGFAVETSLEMQHGVFIYAFFVLCWMKWLARVL